jgi:hypothetical protein
MRLVCATNLGNKHCNIIFHLKLLCTNYFWEVGSITLFSWRGHEDIPALMRGRDLLTKHEFPVRLEKDMSSILKMMYIEETRMMDHVRMYTLKRQVTLFVR